MGRIIVRNLRGTSKRRCACGSWLKHYFNWADSRRDVCAVLGCSNDIEVGAHVEMLNRTDAFHYIVPTCHPCNMSMDDLPLKYGVDSIAANTKFMGCYRPRR